MKTKWICTALMMASLSRAQTPSVPVQNANTPSRPGMPAATQTNTNASQWVRPADTFPPPPGPTPAASKTPSRTPVPNTAYGSGSANTAPSTEAPPVSPNGMAPLPPLAPPSNIKQAEMAIAPLAPDEIIKLRRTLDNTRKAKAYRPVRTVPRISSITVDLSPGAALPIARMLPGEMATLVFVDMAGNPWPLAGAPRVSDNRSFDVEWLQDSSSVIISPLSSYEDGNLAVMLRGFATPVMIKLVTGETDSTEKNRIVDYRLDLRVPGRAPGAPAPTVGAEKISLYDHVLQGFLDGLPPKEATAVTLHGDVPSRTRAWQFEGALFVRTSVDIRSAFEQTMASSDGTRVYRLPPTPYVTLSDGDRSIIVQLDID